MIKVLKGKANLLSTLNFVTKIINILKHVSVGWLSLEHCMDGIVHKQPSLKAYFLSAESFSDKRFERLDEFFRNPLLEQALVFQSSRFKLPKHLLIPRTLILIYKLILN